MPKAQTIWRQRVFHGVGVNHEWTRRGSRVRDGETHTHEAEEGDGQGVALHFQQPADAELDVMGLVGDAGEDAEGIGHASGRLEGGEALAIGRTRQGVLKSLIS